MRLPDGSEIKSIHTALLNIRLFPEIIHALISTSTSCGQGYIVIFDAKKVHIMKDNIIVLHGNQHPMPGFYMVELEGK